MDLTVSVLTPHHRLMRLLLVALPVALAAITLLSSWWTEGLWFVLRRPQGQSCSAYLRLPLPLSWCRPDPPWPCPGQGSTSFPPGARPTGLLRVWPLSPAQ